MAVDFKLTHFTCLDVTSNNRICGFSSSPRASTKVDYQYIALQERRDNILANWTTDIVFSVARILHNRDQSTRRPAP
ncbi:hypothetical protein TNCV_3734461 [Trichonephila clavipes]|nr:hypothetical protein TNCV_3734461 [Trichonephila clavipes]